MKDPCSVGESARLSLIQKLRQIESSKPAFVAFSEIERISQLAGEAADALEQRWQPIETAPVDPYTPDKSWCRFLCLLQNKHGEVFEGWGYYAGVRRKGGIEQELRWASRNGVCNPTHWMRMPAPSSEHARSKP